MSDDQATEQSLEERIASQFVGPDDEPQETEEASQEAEPEVAGSDDEAETQEDTSEVYEEIEFEGQKYQVPPELKEALLRQSDYTKKTQEVAEQRKTIELQQKEIVLAQQQRAFSESVAEDVDNLKMLDAYIKHVENNTDWKSLSTDEIVRARLELDQLKTQKQELQQALQGKYQEFQEKQNAERQKIQKEAEEHLSKSIPSWSAETKSAVEKYVSTLGYPEIGVQNMSALDYQVAWKAMQFDKLQAEKGTAVQKAKQAPPVVKPGSVKRMPKDVQDKLNFRKAIKSAKTSSEKARLIQKRLEQQFGG